MVGSHSVIADPAALAERATRVFLEMEIVPGAGHGLPFQFPDLTRLVVVSVALLVSRRVTIEEAA